MNTLKINIFSCYFGLPSSKSTSKSTSLPPGPVKTRQDRLHQSTRVRVTPAAHQIPSHNGRDDRDATGLEQESGLLEIHSCGHPSLQPGSGATEDQPIEATVEEADEENSTLNAALSLLPPPTHVSITTGRYLSSCVNHRDCPDPRLPEFAVIGRSNVGKSSIINMLTGLKQLALVSKEPGMQSGCTRGPGSTWCLESVEWLSVRNVAVYGVAVSKVDPGFALASLGIRWAEAAYVIT